MAQGMQSDNSLVRQLDRETNTVLVRYQQDVVTILHRASQLKVRAMIHGVAVHTWAHQFHELRCVLHRWTERRDACG